MSEPLALQLYARMLAGETHQQIAEDLGIPLERIQWRLRAAARHVNGRSPDDSTGTSKTEADGDGASTGKQFLKYCRICGDETWRQPLSSGGLGMEVSVCVSCVQRELTVDGLSADPEQ
jgi:hypothetical protein